jgi:hypothetical protein
MKTPEHFEKKLIPSANGFSPMHVQRSAHEAMGYNEALEKTNAKELYEAALSALSVIEWEFESDTKAYEAMLNLKNALEKATGL